VRKRRGWSQQELADRVTATGHRMHRLTVAKIESGGTRAQNASIADVLALAAALDVAPLHLLVPLDDDAAVAITPKEVHRAAVVRGWIRGGRPLRMDYDALLEFLAEIPASERNVLARTLMTRGMDPILLAIAKADPEFDQRAEDLAWELGEGERQRRHEQQEEEE
jgi:transcriptional regulator with XRE-family HTH domain